MPWSPEISFLLAAGVALLLALASIVYLRRSLRQMLTVHLDSPESANFCCAFAHLVLLLMPLFFVGLGRVFLNPRESAFFVVVQYLLWAVGGLVTALLVVAMVVTSLPRRSTTPTPGPLPARRPAPLRPSRN